MIHIHKPAECIKLGLNIEFGSNGRWPWVTLIWCWYDVAKRETYGWRLRIRTHKRPWFLFSRHTSPVVNSYLMENDCVIVDRSVLEDHAPHLDNMLRYYEAGGAYRGTRGIYSHRVK